MSKRDYYEVLGVERTADARALKRAYRARSRQFHPDLNPDDARAEEAFKEVNEAYEVLSNARLRQTYDEHGHEGLRGASAQPGAGFETVEDIVSPLFDMLDGLFEAGREAKRARADVPERGGDIIAPIEVSFAEAARGTSRRVTIEREAECARCHGRGAEPGAPVARCPRCEGTGTITHSQGFFSVSSSCPNCEGRGRTTPDPCSSCQGAGAVRSEATLPVKIPAGVDDGTKLRLRGRGHRGRRGGEPGDVVLSVRVAPSEKFERDKLDLHTRAPISFIQAALGCSILVPTLDEPARVTIPPGSQFGDVFRIEGEGVRHAKKRPGDLFVHLVVVTPTELSEEQRARLASLAHDLGLSLDDAAPLDLLERGHDPIASLKRPDDAPPPPQSLGSRREEAFEEMLRRAEESLRGKDPSGSRR